jgi:hypothetical protein
MMPADGSLSSVPIPADYIDRVRGPFELTRGYEMGGVAINNSPGELRAKQWAARIYVDSSDAPVKYAVQVSPDEVTWTTLFSRTGKVTEIALAFAQLMNPFIAFVEDGVSRIWWFDTAADGYVFTDLPAGSRSPRCCLDDRRHTQTAVSDIVLVYMRSDVLYARLQRERYETEHTLAIGLGPDARFVAVAMNKGLRLQFQLARVDE